MSHRVGVGGLWEAPPWVLGLEGLCLSHEGGLALGSGQAGGRRHPGCSFSQQ